eukprot:gene31045-38372_t
MSQGVMPVTLHSLINVGHKRPSLNNHDNIDTLREQLNAIQESIDNVQVKLVPRESPISFAVKGVMTMHSDEDYKIHKIVTQFEPTAPSRAPSIPPSVAPSFSPSVKPSIAPSCAPSTAPTSAIPTCSPTQSPSASPTAAPSEQYIPFNQIATYAGTGTAGSDGDRGPATSATLNGPAGVYFDSANSIYIAESEGFKIRSVGLDGKISTVAGTGVAGFSGGSMTPGTSSHFNGTYQVFVDSSNVYVADSNNNVIRQVESVIMKDVIVFAGRNGSVNQANPFIGDGGPKTSATLYSPRGVYMSRSRQYVYISEFSGQRIRVVDTSLGNSISTYAGTGFTNSASSSSSNGAVKATSVNLNGPSQLFADSSGTLYVADTNSYVIRSIDSTNYARVFAGVPSLPFMLTTSGPATSMNTAGHMVNLAGSRTVYPTSQPTAQPTSHPTRSYHTLNQIKTAAGTGNDLNEPGGLCTDLNGRLLVSDALAGMVLTVSKTSGIINTIAGGGGSGEDDDYNWGDGGQATSAYLSSPVQIFATTSGNLYIADSGNGKVLLMNIPSGTIALLAGDPYSEVIRQIKAGSVSTFAGKFGGDGIYSSSVPMAATSAALNSPQGVWGDSEGRMYISESGGNKINRVGVGGLVVVLAGSGSQSVDPTNSNGDGGPPTAATF